MIRTAASLFRAQGYHATGLNQVLVEGGAPKGSLYFHFPGGKEQLAVEAVTLAGAAQCERLRAVLAETPDPVTALARALDVLAQDLVDSDFRDGCPISTVALDVGGDNEPIRVACADAYASWQRIIADHVGSESLAAVVLAALEGALLLARTQRDLAPLRALETHLAPLLGRTSP